MKILLFHIYLMSGEKPWFIQKSEVVPEQYDPLKRNSRIIADALRRREGEPEPGYIPVLKMNEPQSFLDQLATQARVQDAQNKNTDPAHIQLRKMLGK